MRLYRVSGNRAFYSGQSLALVEYALLANNNVYSTDIPPAECPADLLHCLDRTHAISTVYGLA